MEERGRQREKDRWQAERWRKRSRETNKGREAERGRATGRERTGRR